DKILLGYGAVGNDHPISTANRYHNADLPQREFDADKAAYHYKKSGHSGKIQLSASDAAFAGAVDAAQLIANSAAEAGIDIEVIREPRDGYWSKSWNKSSAYVDCTSRCKKEWCENHQYQSTTRNWIATIQTSSRLHVG
ncbi:MAG: peptide ABC transporter substrate-binding protein, partial [Candidatus Poseidoniaceae archaeon]